MIRLRQHFVFGVFDSIEAWYEPTDQEEVDKLSIDTFQYTKSIVVKVQ